MGSHTLPLPAPHVEETRFGKWFLRTQTWRVHVLERAMTDLVRLIPSRQPAYGVVIDVGCGSGYSLPRLAQRFLPRELIGVDIDPEMLAVARRELERADDLSPPGGTGSGAEGVPARAQARRTAAVRGVHAALHPLVDDPCAVSPPDGCAAQRPGVPADAAQRRLHRAGGLGLLSVPVVEPFRPGRPGALVRDRAARGPGRNPVERRGREALGGQVLDAPALRVPRLLRPPPRRSGGH